MKRTLPLLALVVLGVFLAGRMSADEPATPSSSSTSAAASAPSAAAPETAARDAAGEQSPDELAIRKSVKDYVDAFNKHDAKALAAFWSPDAIYVNRMSGEQVVGRDKIAEQFTSMFKAIANVKLTADTKSIQFISPNVAVERGISQLILPVGGPETIPYSAVYVKRDGNWLLDRITDEAKQEKDEAESHEEHLKPIEWMIGHWVDKDDHVDVETDCNWTKNRTFITRSFTVAVDGESKTSGIQIVGWDAGAKKIRSWTFDSDGGYAEATWTKHGDRWYISNEGVLADGRKASMVNVIKPIDANSFTWATIERTAGGELLPNVPEVLIVRE